MGVPEVPHLAVPDGAVEEASHSEEQHSEVPWGLDDVVLEV